MGCGSCFAAMSCFQRKPADLRDFLCEPGSHGLVLAPLEKRAEQIIEGHQGFSDDMTSFLFRVWQRNQSPSLPPSDQKRSSKSGGGPFAPHHKFSALVVFENKSFDIHTGSPLSSAVVPSALP
jgi:hypothetical protein